VISAPVLQQAINNYDTCLRTLQQLAEEGSLAEEEEEEDLERTPPSPLPCLLIRNKFHTFSVPKGLGVPPQLLHFEILGASKAKRTGGSESTWSDSGSTYFDGDDGHLDASGERPL
jgi:hypothetical protein